MARDQDISATRAAVWKISVDKCSGRAKMDQTKNGRSNFRSTFKKHQVLIFKAVTWGVAIFCFYLAYSKILASAESREISVLEFVTSFFANVDWIYWLLIMVPYSIFFFVVDTHAAWRAIKWFNTPELTYRNIMPIRASALILSIVSEQVGKGAMSLYLLRRYKVPGWEAISTMVVLGICEIYQLLIFSSLGVLFYYEFLLEADWNFPVIKILISIFGLAALYVPIHFFIFNRARKKSSGFFSNPVFASLRKAEVYHYLLLLFFKAPNLLGAVLVYSLALSLFGFEVPYSKMLMFLPLIFLAAALPLPFHAGALVIWMLCFPEFPEVSIFSLIMHTFFLSMNAFIGVCFLPYANKELFAGKK